MLSFVSDSRADKKTKLADWGNLMFPTQNENLAKFRSTASVFFPELKAEIIGVVDAYRLSDLKGNQCVISQFTDVQKSVPKTNARLEFAAAVDCMYGKGDIALQVDTAVIVLVEAAKQRLAIFFFDPSMVPTDATAKNIQNK